jgi:DNA polymerase-3 subunit epsilon
MALLLECTEIKDLPVYNKALKRFEPKYGLFEYEAKWITVTWQTGKIRVALKLLTLFMTE